MILRDPEPSDIIVACGAHRIERPDPSPQDRNELRVNISEIIIHEDFSWSVNLKRVNLFKIIIFNLISIVD